jgi:uncharacterized repeat protein (TIGR02543 family)
MKKMKMKKGSMFLAAALIMAALVLTGCETPVDVGSVICTVRFYPDGGTFDDEDTPQSLTVNSGASVGLLPMKLTKGGYIFGGWYTERYGGGTLVTARTTVSGSITVYAKWIGEYTVTFNANGGTFSGGGTPPAAQTVYAGSGITLPSGDGLSKPGNTFGGWNTNSAGTGTNYSAGASYTPTSSITLYAKWMPDQYTVTFDADGEPLSGDEITLTVGHNALVGTLPTATKNGYNFGGWYTGQNGEGNAFTASTLVTGNITVHAKWTPTGTITVTFTGPGDENIDLSLSYEQTLSWSLNTTLIAIVSEGFSPYRWALDGKELEGETVSTLTLHAGELSVDKEHSLTAVVTKDDVEYTKLVTFTVNL